MPEEKKDDERKEGGIQGSVASNDDKDREILRKDPLETLLGPLSQGPLYCRRGRLPPLLPRLKLKPPRCQGSCLIRGQQKELGRRYNESRVMRADCCTNLLPRTMPARVKLCKYRCLREGDGRSPCKVIFVFTGIRLAIP